MLLKSERGNAKSIYDRYQIMVQVIPILLAGVSGPWLWPLSRKTKPKQFFTLEKDKSLFLTNHIEIFSLSLEDQFTSLIRTRETKEKYK
jgi:mannose-1-phosphate guanylyltransferase